MVIVPDLVTDTPPLKRNPVFLYYSDRFTRPQPFRADIVVSIDDVFEKKVNMLDAHVSQFYEWLPWTQGQFEQVPKDPAERKKWLEVGPLASRKLRSEEHTSELQSPCNLVCRLLLEKKKKKENSSTIECTAHEQVHAH